jgi:IclR family transcriptional regulator, acetate operon repressor
MGAVSTARDRPPEEAAEDSSFARGLRLLLTVADRGEISADDLAKLLGMPLSTAYRYLRTLTEFGFVDRVAGQYRLGPRLLVGSSGSNVPSEQLIRLSDPVLRMLVEETGETALVMRRVGLSAMCLHQVESKKGMRVVLEPGAISPLYAGAMARILLAYAPEDIVKEVVGNDVEPITSNTPSKEMLPGLLDEIRAGKIAVSEGELIAGSVTVAVPIVSRDGIVGALAVTGPEGRCGITWRASVRKLLPDASAHLAAALEES